nr:hypothetical protein [Tanacetum cinerariifolium]
MLTKKRSNTKKIGAKCLKIPAKNRQFTKLEVRSHKKQFDKYMEIKKQWVTRIIDVDMEYDLSDIEFSEWIETDIFDFEIPICKAFNKSNYLLKTDIDLLTSDILGFKTYNEFNNEWMNKWNKGIPWVPEELWSKNRISIDDIHHICERRRYDDLVDVKLKEKRSWGDATQGVMNFYAWLKRCFGKFHELDYELLRSHMHETYANSNINDNYIPYLDVSRTFNNHKGRNDEEAIQQEREPNDDHGIGNLDNDLVWDNASYHANEKEEQYEEDRCEMLENPRQEPSIFKIRRFEVIKYSFGPSEKYINIKECEYEDLTRTKKDACHAYQ